MKIVILLVSLLSLACADREGGPYLGAGYAYNIYHDDGQYSEFQEDNAESWLVYAGAYINKNLSVELSYHDYGSFKIDSLQTEKIKAYYARTLAHYPLMDDALDLYAVFGVGELRTKTASEAGFAYLYGAGVAYRFTEKMALRLAYEKSNFSYTDLSEDKKYNLGVESIYTAVEVQF